MSKTRTRLDGFLKAAEHKAQALSDWSDRATATVDILSRRIDNSVDKALAAKEGRT
ncbi:hypothetical protein [Mameliella alba]|uniref:hypothetical protein n=1 Tax=Mameliella alba TaxID=561184 RepID=UPI0012FF6D76|nr:hypothetical protein [Mameliella alba]MBY6120200.1 hypothetical protein [Mameliella alba]